VTDGVGEQPVRLAATAILIRAAGDGGLEVLLGQRSRELAFHGGSWAFPGGRVEPGDYAGLRADDHERAARNAAVREAREEVGLVIEPDRLVHFSHWTTPPGRPRRFATCFFLGAAPAGRAAADGIETTDCVWVAPDAALAAHTAGNLELPPATFTSLLRLARYPDVASALGRSRAHPYVRFVPRQVEVDGGTVSLYAEDCCYERADDLDRPGPRHRLWMVGRPWRYEAPAHLLG
jgi:8-oxo-dGTP pyrophosphatase MutT (NUDIX family)